MPFCCQCWSFLFVSFDVCHLFMCYVFCSLLTLGGSFDAFHCVYKREERLVVFMLCSFRTKNKIIHRHLYNHKAHTSSFIKECTRYNVISHHSESAVQKTIQCSGLMSYVFFSLSCPFSKRTSNESNCHIWTRIYLNWINYFDWICLAIWQFSWPVLRWHFGSNDHDYSLVSVKSKSSFSIFVSKNSMRLG